MKRNFLVFGVLFFSLLSLNLILASPASLHAPRIHVKNGYSTNWAGYAIQTDLQSPQNNVMTFINGSWTVPSVTCSPGSTSYSSFWLGIDGYSSNTVEQTGTDSDCSSGTPRYYAWYEMYPKYPVNLKMKVSPGDVMYAEVKFLNPSTFILTIIDKTTGASFSTTQKYNKALRSSAEWIAEAPSSIKGVLPLSNFGTVNFQGSYATVNGVTSAINNPSWQNDDITMVTSSGTTKAQPSSLSSDGSSFSVKWFSN